MHNIIKFKYIFIIWKHHLGFKWFLTLGGFLFEYTISVVKEENVDEIYKLMIEVIELGISSPDASIGEILDLVKGGMS